MYFRKFLLISILFQCSISAFSQTAHLKITDLGKFALLSGDSAFEGTSYDSIQMTVKNTGSTLFSDSLRILLQTGKGVVDVLYSGNANTLIQPNDSVRILISSYQFTPVHFDDGDNIVVVWPSAAYSSVQSDTTSFHVYFVSFALGVNSPSENPILVYPNPATRFIALQLPDKNNLKYVRIFNTFGQLLRSSEQPLISISDLPSGTYLIETLQNDGKRFFVRIQKL